MDTPFLGLDVGNSRLSAAIVSRDGHLLALARADTPPQARAALDPLVSLAEGTIAEHGTRPAAVGIGFGGPVDLKAGRVRASFLSSGWEGLALGEIVAQRLGLPAFLANDADAGGLAEAMFGAGQGAASMLYVNVGTGIGGAVLLGGRLHTGATSSAGEIGHFVVVPGGPRCECGKRGCAQALSSGTAIARRAGGLLDAGDDRSALRQITRAELSGWDVGRAALQGDVVARRAIDEAAWWLGIAVANAVHLLDPERVVIGGGVAELGEAWLRPVRASYRSHIFGPATDTPIVAAALGYDAGVIGAAALAMSEQGARSAP